MTAITFLIAATVELLIIYSLHKRVLNLAKRMTLLKFIVLASVLGVLIALIVARINNVAVRPIYNTICTGDGGDLISLFCLVAGTASISGSVLGNFVWPGMLLNLADPATERADILLVSIATNIPFYALLAFFVWLGARKHNGFFVLAALMLVVPWAMFLF